MISVQIKQSDIDKLAREIAKRGDSYRDKMKTVVHRSALSIESRAKLNVTEDSSDGRLRASIISELDPQRPSANVHTAVFYAPYVEFGTGERVFQNTKNGYNFTDEDRQYASQFIKGPGRNSPARPFLFPASEVERPRLLNALKALDI